MIQYMCLQIQKYMQILQRKNGADVPFLRNAETATDTSSTWDAVKYVLQEYEKQGKAFDVITVLQPTSPLRTSRDIKKMHTAFFAKRKQI